MDQPVQLAAKPEKTPDAVLSEMTQEAFDRVIELVTVIDGICIYQDAQIRNGRNEVLFEDRQHLKSVYEKFRELLNEGYYAKDGREASRVYTWLNALENARIVIRDNNSTLNESCPLCGRPVDADTPYWYFVEHTVTPVCESCAKKNNTPLVEMLQWWNENRRPQFWGAGAEYEPHYSSDIARKHALDEHFGFSF